MENTTPPAKTKRFSPSQRVLEDFQRTRMPFYTEEMKAQAEANERSERERENGVQQPQVFDPFNHSFAQKTKRSTCLVYLLR